MGELIKGKFGAERGGVEEEPSQKGPERKAAPSGEFIDDGDVSRLLEIISRAGMAEISPNAAALRKCVEIEMHLRGLGGPISANSVAFAEKYWSELGTEELVQAAENSNKQEWSKYPGRYRALAKILRARIAERR